MVEVGRFFTALDARVAQSALASAGVSSVITTDGADGAFPFDVTGGTRLLVRAAHAKDAIALLNEPAP
jgi:hypothetical protein